MVLHFRRSSLEHQSISIERSVQFSNYCDQNTIQTEIVFIFEGLMSLNKGKEKNIPVVYFDLSKPTDKIRCILRWWWPDQHVLVPFNFYDSVENVIFFGLWLYDSRKDTRAMKHIFFSLNVCIFLIFTDDRSFVVSFCWCFIFASTKNFHDFLDEEQIFTAKFSLRPIRESQRWEIYSPNAKRERISKKKKRKKNAFPSKIRRLLLLLRSHAIKY